MKTLLFILFLFIFSPLSFSQNVPLPALSEAMSNVLNLYGDKASSTCFIITNNNKQYFVTAAHLFDPSHKSGDQVPIKLLIQNEFQSFTATIYFHENRKVDIAIIKLPENISQNLQVPDELIKFKDTLQKVFPGNGISRDSIPTNIDMEVLFFGFPLGNLGTEAFGIRFLLVKKAIISGWVQYNGVELLLLDGHNNLGFSGGPVVTYDAASKKMCIVGVISGYIPEPVDVQHKKDTFSINQNSGIIVCYGKRYIEDVFLPKIKRGCIETRQQVFAYLQKHSALTLNVRFSYS